MIFKHLIFAILALACIFMLAACAQYPIRAGLSFSDSGREVDVSTDGKSVRVHGGIDVGGKTFGGQVDLQLPKRAGLAK